MSEMPTTEEAAPTPPKKKRSILKTAFLGIAGLMALLIVGVAVFGCLNWDAVSTMIDSGGIEGHVEAVPTTTAAKTAPAPAAAETGSPEPGTADWVCWRGARGDGVSDVTGIPADFADLKEAWSVSFLCQGRNSAAWSAPVVKGGKLVVCGRDDENDLVFCLDPASGGLIWKATYATRAGSSHGAGFRATPAIDSDRVYTFGRSGDLVCWSLGNGKQIWRRNVGDEGGKEPRWGHSTSPLVTGDLVMVNAGGAARTLAYDKVTGELKWKSGTGEAGYAGLVAMDLEGRPAVLTFHGTGLAALDPTDGRVLWDTPWRTSYNVNATTPVCSGDQVFITSGYKTGCQLLKVTRSSASPVWTSKVIASHHSDPFIVDGHIYGYSGQSVQNKGHFKCVNLATGAEEWATDELGWGTCVMVDGHLLCLDIKGNLYLVKPDPAKLVLVTSKSRALGSIRGPAWTVPVVAGGRLFLRFKQTLVCYPFGKSSKRAT